MTVIKYHAIYAKADREAARWYRINFRKFAGQVQHYMPGFRHEGEINEPERRALLNNKGINEAREPTES